VVRVKVEHEGKVLTVLQTDALPGGYSSEWEELRGPRVADSLAASARDQIP
jgi:hypothetical protein